MNQEIMSSFYWSRFSHLILGLLFADAATMAGCMKPYQIEIRSGTSIPIETVAILPCQFRWDEPAYRSYEIGQTLALQALEVGSYSVYGPGEINISPVAQENLSAEPDLTLGLAHQGLSSATTLIVRPSLERQIKTELRQVFDLTGSPKGAARGDEVTVVARLEAFHSSTMELVADVSAKIMVDPLNQSPSSDPLPEVTATMSQMMKDILEQLSFRAPGQMMTTRGAGFEFIWNPKAVFDFSFGEKPALVDSLAQMDLLERDMTVENRLRFFLPSASGATLSAFRNLPPGLWVTSIANPEKSSVKVGDLIVEVNGQPATPQSLDRALRVAGPGKPLYFKIHH